MARCKLSMAIGLLGILLIGFLSACGNASTPMPMTKQAPTPLAVPATVQPLQPSPTTQSAQAAAAGQLAVCSPTLPSDTVYVTDGQSEVAPQAVIPYAQDGFCEVLYIVPASGKLSVGFHGSGVIASLYSERIEEKGVSRTIMIFQTGSWFDVQPYTGTYANASKLTAQPLAVSVYYPQGSETMQPAALPTNISGASLIVATDNTFNLPVYPSLPAALCALSTVIQ